MPVMVFAKGIRLTLTLQAMAFASTQPEMDYAQSYTQPWPICSRIQLINLRLKFLFGTREVQAFPCRSPHGI
jgi:hypothetical protein